VLHFISMAAEEAGMTRSTHECRSEYHFCDGLPS
jgi:hypothetical protein